MKLSEPQKRALNKLTEGWRSAYDLQEGLNTLNSLVNKKLAERWKKVGADFFPHNETYYRLKKPKAFKVEIKNNPPFSPTWDLIVNSKVEIQGEAYGVVSGIKESLLGFTGGAKREVDEVADVIKKRYGI